jgi:sigma-B regulation protein RsbU (phosphoserine phosphatase)
MRKALIWLAAVLCLGAHAAVRSAAWSDFWDFPHVIAKTSDSVVKADVKAVEVGRKVLVFYLNQGQKSAEILYLPTEDFVHFGEPSAAKKGIELKEGFSPHFDVALMGGTLYLTWNSLEGTIMLSRSADGGATWSKETVLVKDKNFCFAPRLFFESGSIFLFYHTESEGSRIDFFSIQSRDSGATWTSPFQIAKGFAGSFFPVLSSRGNDLYVVWQSRPFSQVETPVFNAYLAVSRDGGKSWSAPVPLTQGAPGENTRPFISFGTNRLSLVWESDRGEASGIYYREYDLAGKPIADEVKVQGAISNARDPKRVPSGEDFTVSYVDGRDGAERLYYARRVNGKFEETGPLGRPERDILHYNPLGARGQLFFFLQEKGTIVFQGPDRGVPPLKVLTAGSQYIGKRGVLVRWEELKDSSGLEGYAYGFDLKEDTEPEIVNLTAFTTSVRLMPEGEGTYYFHLRARDKAGNYSRTVTLPFTVDLKPPPAPAITPMRHDVQGFYRDNSPIFQWSVDASDLAGYNYVLSRQKVAIKDSGVKTPRGKAGFRSLQGGTWYFNVAAVDRAGNVGETASVALRLRPRKGAVPSEVSPGEKEHGKGVRLVSPPWILSRESYEANPVMNITLYLVLGGLLVITFFLFADIFFALLTPKKDKTMQQTEGIRKKRFGLRFKFSLLIAALILILTIGISAVLSSISIESQKRSLALQMMDKARLSLENMTNVAREGILNNDDLLLLSVITKTMENKDIEFSVILDRENRVVAHSEIAQQGKTLSDEFTLSAAGSTATIVTPEFSPDNLAKIYTLASPIVFAGKRIGTVEIGYSTESIFRTIDEARRKNLVSSAIVTVATILVGIIGAIFMATITIRPIKILAEGANIIGSGKLEHKIHIKASDEIGLLSDEFNRMTERLLEYQKRMEEKAKLDEQLEIARNIQQSLIPQAGIENEHISIGGFYKAATGVGGDYYDFIQIDGGLYGLIMSDVAGKGVPASLMMIMIRSVFKSLIQSGVSEPAKVVSLMNNTLASDISADRFATLLFGVYNQKNRLFRYTNAGYGPLLIYKTGRKKCFLVSPPQGSTPIGVMPDVQYGEEKPIQLERGDSVFLFTDGIHESRNEREEEYGMERLAGVIPGFADRDSREMANLIIQDVLRFVGTAAQFDDMTLTVMKAK